MTARIIHMHLQRLEAREDGLASLTKAELDELIWPGAFSFDGAASLAGWVGTHGWPRRRLPRKPTNRTNSIDPRNHSAVISPKRDRCPCHWAVNPEPAPNAHPGATMRMGVNRPNHDPSRAVRNRAGRAQIQTKPRAFGGKRVGRRWGEVKCAEISKRPGSP